MPSQSSGGGADSATIEQPGDNMEDPQIAPLLCVKSIRQGVTGRRSNESRMTVGANDDRDIRPAIRQLKMPTGGSMPDTVCERGGNVDTENEKTGGRATARRGTWP